MKKKEKKKNGKKVCTPEKIKARKRVNFFFKITSGCKSLFFTL